MANLSDYIVKFNSVDTLASVTARGSTTSSNITVGNLTSTGIDDNATSTALTVTDSGIAATLTTASQPNITSVGTLSGFSSTGIDDNATSTAITIDSDGDVGIGLASPLFQATNRTAVTINGTTSSNLTFGVGGSANTYFLADSAGFTIGNTSATLPTMFYTNSAERMRIDSSGNVGIGTTNPTAYANQTNLNINSSGVSRIDFDISDSLQGYALAESGYVGLFANTGNYLALGANNAEHMRIDSSGNVGINSTTPSSIGFGTGATKLFVSAPNSNFGSAISAVADSAGRGLQIATQAKTTTAGIDLTSSVSTFYSTTELGLYASGAERMRIDANGNVGIGLIPNTWSTGKAVELGFEGNALWGNAADEIIVSQNAYYNSGWKYATTRAASHYSQYNGAHRWFTAASGTADTAITWTQAMTLDANGNVGIGDSSPTAVTSNATTLEIKGRVTTKGGAIKLNSSDESINSFIYPDSTNGLSINMLTAHPMRFLTSGTERMRIDSSGNVAIGDTTATEKLYVHGNALVRSGYGYKYGNGQVQHYSNDSYLRFRTGGTDRLTIDANGLVGINTTNPATFLEVAHATTGVANNITTYNSNTAASAECAVDWALNRTGSEAKMRAARITAGKEQTWTTTASTVDGYLKFLTVRDESLNEAMRIDSSGNLLVGHTTNTSGNGSTGKINVRQDSTTTTTAPILAANEAASGSLINFSGNGGGVGTSNRIYHGGSAVVYGTASDERLKKNITSAPSALAILNSVEAVSFDWKATDQHTKYGFIAQQFVDVVPDAVIKGDTEEDHWGMDYGKVTPFLLKAIQEQQAMIDELKAEVAALKGE